MVSVRKIMIMMKKAAALLLAFMMIAGMTGCSAGEEVSLKEEEGLSVVTTLFAAYDFAGKIGGDNVNVTMLLKPGTESHTYEPAPRDIKTIQECDVFIFTGGENDKWVETVLEGMDNNNMKIIRLLECTEVLEEEYVEGMQHDHEGHEEHEEHEEHEADKSEWDEHVWTSPRNAILICNEIEKAFSMLDAENADEYRDNLNTYTEELNELDEAIREVTDSASRKLIVFGDRFPVRYFVEEYGIDYAAAFPGCSAEAEASAATLAYLIDKVKTEQIPVVFKIELSNGNIAETIAESTGAEVMTFYACHNVSADDFEAGLTYVDFMYKNLEALKAALK